MVSILIALTGIIICAIFEKSLLSLLLEITALGLTAFISNYMFRPRIRSFGFKNEDYVLEAEYTLEPLCVNSDGKPVYVKRKTSKAGNKFIAIKCKGKGNQPARERALPRQSVRLILDDRAYVRLFGARKKYRGNILLSVMATTHVDLIAEIHTPDSIAAFSGDKEVR